ncbi:phosphoribosylamine--glycine ligase [Luteitalea sp. TBR-22]|uniref:phosphoribosylamine--glycine ligase n=1 Tax=Luteitalea sp. TBR-22 TaxID=2802971 RepID=UPI001AF22A3D|nr:phosphoribosylamine--glycine ligase [Luteitalea sp. TBR-22]BCS31321.1 phosphoribosylamine--glycine ligase [Luteitalea sp. TBR-22]
MKVLVLGGGGREHALAWKLRQESGVAEVLCAPGNPGTATCARTVALDILDPAAVTALVAAEGVDLVIVGPEQPLAAGVSDALRAAGHPVFGPSQDAARLETSKAFSKAFMDRHGVPTARARICTTADEAEVAVRAFGAPVVVKADGLAAGKGVTVAATLDEALAAVDAAMRQGAFGAAGSTVVVEECLTGPEVSYFAVCDGTRALPLGTAQDHKRAYDGDAGPNTGGMGALAPSPLVDAGLSARVMRTIVEPVLAGMRAEGYPFAGILYCGLMLTPDGPKVIEFNVRFGDPEAQVVLPLLPVPLAPLALAAAKGALPAEPLPAVSGARVGVVLASGGYPGAMTTGYPIDGLAAAAAMPGVTVFHAGTKTGPDGTVLTSGGRVLTVVGEGVTLQEARDRAYAGVAQISFKDMEFRRDIAARYV